MYIWLVCVDFDWTTYGFSTKEKALDFVQTYINDEGLTKELVYESPKGAEYDLYDEESGDYVATVNICDYRLDSGLEI